MMAVVLVTFERGFSVDAGVRDCLTSRRAWPDGESTIRQSRNFSMLLPKLHSLVSGPQDRLAYYM
jgi:hypothetical protein